MTNSESYGKGKKMSQLQQEKDEKIIELAERLIAEIEAVRPRKHSNYANKYTATYAKSKPLNYKS